MRVEHPDGRVSGVLDWLTVVEAEPSATVMDKGLEVADDVA